MGERQVLREQIDRLLQIRSRLPDIHADDLEEMDGGCYANYTDTFLMHMISRTV